MVTLKSWFTRLVILTRCCQVILHEIGHVLACLAVGSKIAWVGFDFIPEGKSYRVFGLTIRHYRSGVVRRYLTGKLWKEVVIALGGPVANIAIFVVTCIGLVTSAQWENWPVMIPLAAAIVWLTTTSGDFFYENLLSTTIGSDGYHVRLALKTRSFDLYLETLESTTDDGTYSDEND